MKKNLLLLSFSTLLLVSSGIYSQTADRKNAAISQDLSATQSTSHRFDEYADEANRQNELILATAEIYTDNESYDPNTDVHLNRSGYKRTPVRKRFQEK